MSTFKQLADESKLIITIQLKNLHIKATNAEMSPHEAATLLSITKWLNEMAILEEEELLSIEDPLERKRVKDARKAKAWRDKKKLNDNASKEDIGSSEETPESQGSNG